MTGYDLSRQWFDFAFENSDKVSGNHTALYWWSIELNNRLGWVKKFGMPTEVAMSACGIRSFKTYSKIFNDLVEWGFFEVHQRSKNQYTSNVIALVFFTEASPKQYQSIDQSITNAIPKHSSGTVDINKQETLETNKPINLKTDVDADRVGFENVVEEPSSKEKKETPSKVAQKVSPSVHARIREVIQTENKGYYWQEKDGRATKSIIKKITFRWGEKNGGEPTEDQIVESFVWLVKNLPEWYKNKWDACLIESKFESIVKEIHEQRNGNKQNGNSYGQPGANGISPRLAEAWELLDKSRKAVPT